MKDSGIEWIGEIPSHWKLKRLKALFEERKDKNDPIQTDFILSLGAAYGVVPYAEKEGGGNKAKEDLSDYRLAYPNDIVMNSMNIISGSVGISKYYGCVSPVYYMLYPRYYEEADPNYYCYMFQTKAFQRSLLGLGNGILIKESANGNFNTVRMRIPMEKLGVQLLPTPPLAEQKAIADFLDKQCAEIDSVIEQTKATIEEYKALKQSVITEAVTKGIRGDRPMKDSGIEWIGEIPSEWDVSAIKNHFDVYSGATPKSEHQEFWDGDIIWITPADYKTEDKYISGGKRTITTEGYESCGTTLVPKNSIIFSKRAPIGSVAISDKPLCTNQGCLACVDKGENSVLYYYFSMSVFTEIFELFGSGTTFKEISFDSFSAFRLPHPSYEEQQEIADYLDQKCSEIDTLIEKKTSLLEEMESLKKSIIFEYVTGKKKVLN